MLSSSQHEEVVDNLYKLLKKYCSIQENSTCENLQKYIRRDNADQEYALATRNYTLETFFILRCTILWKLAQTQKTCKQLSHLHSTCTHAEKKALAFDARFHGIEFPGQSIFLQSYTSNPSKDLHRLTTTHLTLNLLFNDDLI